ncbi:MAG: hypothetical protein COA39_005490 [Sulfurimonas sp.]|nr:hypothetical protein [Sulfurimonas sp.]
MQYNKNFCQIKSNETIFQSIEEEVSTIAYYNLPLQDTTNIKKYTQSIQQKYIAIIGIGGRTLGTKTIYNFLKKSKIYDKSLHFFESTDPIDIKSKLTKIDLEDTHFIIISKSRTTIETISIFKYLSSLITINEFNSTIVSEIDSKLTKYANKHNIKTFEIPKNVGGRFSVFSPVDLVPLSAVGVNIDDLLTRAKEVRDSFFNKQEYYDQSMKKARFLVENKNKFKINVIFSYSSALANFNQWYIQL